jgi:hypothetical protein
MVQINNMAPEKVHIILSFAPKKLIPQRTLNDKSIKYIAFMIPFTTWIHMTKIR